MKRGYLGLVFLFVLACFLPFAMAPPAQASGTMLYNNHATIIANPAAGQIPDPGGGNMIAIVTTVENMNYPTNSLGETINKSYDMANPWNWNMEVFIVLKYPDSATGTKNII